CVKTRISPKYPDIQVIVKGVSNDGLSVLRSQDKDSDKAYVQEVLQQTWESTDERFYKLSSLCRQ
ncbi:putative DNA damage-inducible protein, partial [Erwinia tracheiphila PSU-1]|uniref:DinI-like family protein n=1 Tax=Erwinia tracheiphila TaxID=65700 RepID=UPI0003375D96